MKNKNECFILQRKMKRLIFSILFIVPVGLYSANHKKWKQTASGIYFKIYTKDTAKLKPVYGDHIWMHLRKFSPKKKEIFNTRIFDTKRGVEMDYKQPVKEIDVTEIFAYMGIGDSAFVKIPSAVYDSNGSAKKYYTFWLNLIDFKQKDAYVSEKAEQDKLQNSIDSFAIIDYLQKNNLLDATADLYGNWYLRQEFGKGKPVKIGDSINIHYTGKLLNGFEFDNSYGRNQTLPFIIGKKQVIDGLDKGIQNFYIGDIGLLIIPSKLGYGDKEVGKIPANSVLIFEIEILE